MNDVTRNNDIDDIKRSIEDGADVYDGDDIALMFAEEYGPVEIKK